MRAGGEALLYPCARQRSSCGSAGRLHHFAGALLPFSLLASPGYQSFKELIVAERSDRAW